MKDQVRNQILIPEGCFTGDCYSCFSVKSKSMQEDGRMFCKNYNKYVFPSDSYGCPDYCWKVKGWIKLILLLYFVIAILYAIISLVF